MSSAYIKRYLKLLPHRTYHISKPHFLPIVSVLFLIGVTVFVFTRLPSLSPMSVSSPPVSKFSHLPISAPPTVSAKNVFILDMDTSEVIYQKNADDEIYPASTTKIVSALVILDHFALDEIITIDKEFPEGQVLGLKIGESFTVENLLYALLIHSANDAAEVFAQKYPGGRTAFVEEMNNLVSQQGLLHTHFKNPTGLDEEGHYSSAADLARLANLAMHRPLFKRIVSSESSVISTTDHSAQLVLTNTNELLGKTPGVLGVKTGFTDKAGESLISEVDRESKKILIAVMGSQDRFGDTQKLIDWAYSP